MLSRRPFVVLVFLYIRDSLHTRAVEQPNMQRYSLAYLEAGTILLVTHAFQEDMRAAFDIKEAYEKLLTSFRTVQLQQQGFADLHLFPPP